MSAKPGSNDSPAGEPEAAPQLGMPSSLGEFALFNECGSIGLGLHDSKTDE